MNLESEKHELLYLVQTAYEQILRMADELTAEQKQEKGGMHLWSARDTLAHLTFWSRHFNSKLEKSARGEAVYPVQYFNQINDGVLLEHMEQPFEEALVEFKATQAELAEKYKAFSASELADPGKFIWLEGRPLSERIISDSITHPILHLCDFYAKHQQLERAMEIQENLPHLLKDFPGAAATASYNLACFYALNGMQQKAIPLLEESFQIRPDL